MQSTVTYTKENGLQLCWQMPNGISVNAPVRVKVRGANLFNVWGTVDSGEGLPAWADTNFNPVLFAGNDESCRVETLSENGDITGYRAFAGNSRIEASVEFRDINGELSISMQLRNPQYAGGQRLPLCLVELQICNLYLGDNAEFASAHSYGGRTHGVGKITDLVEPGMPFPHGCIGLALPLVYLHNPSSANGMQFEFMMDGRPTLWLRPGELNNTATCVINWMPDRLLLPGQSHIFGGDLKIKPTVGRPVQLIRDWRDNADARYGIHPPQVADWVKRRSCIELHLFPGAYKEFTHLDDPALYVMLKRWRDWGYDAIMAVSPNPVVTNFLSPLHYHASEEAGGAAAEQVMLKWMHELGFHVGIWFTTVGLDKTAPEVKERRDWWTHRPNQELFYAWDSTPATNFVGYAPDADPGSTGWRKFMLDQLDSLLERGWNGVFIDGCIPRASNHARWFWPGETRNSVEDQVAELAETIRNSGKDAILVDEDSGLVEQVVADITTGRYTPMVPFIKKAYWDHGMGGGPKELGEPPARISPEMARDYLLIRYASLLPGAISEDGVEGYCSEEARPWTVVSMLAGPTTFKTHAEYLNDPLTFRQLSDSPPAGALANDIENRRKGYEEFLKILRLRADDPIIGADTPLSIEGVKVEGDQAVVGLLRPTANRCLLVIIQFADRPATVKVRLSETIDCKCTTNPHRQEWKTREILSSMVNPELTSDGVISGEKALEMNIGAYGFRVFEMKQ